MSKEIQLCKNCYGKGYSTELQGDQFCLADFIGDKTFKYRSLGVRVRFCSCGRGKDLKLMFNVKKEFKQ